MRAAAAAVALMLAAPGAALAQPVDTVGAAPPDVMPPVDSFDADLAGVYSDTGFHTENVGLFGIHESVIGRPAATVLDVGYNPAETILARIGEGLTLTIVLPASEVIADYVIGSAVVEPVKMQTPSRNTLVLRGKGVDAGASVTVFGRSGRLYSFYMSVLPVTSEQAPHLVVRVLAPSTPIVGSAVTGGAVGGAGGELQTAGSSVAPASKVPDFASPAVARTLDFGYTMAGDAVAAPDIVFSDGVFTYLWWEPGRWGVSSMPAVFRSVDDVDVPAQVEVEHTTVIVKAVGALTLRAGGKVVCVRPARPPGGPGRATVTALP